MAFAFKLNLSVSLGPQTAKEGLYIMINDQADDDWAERLADQIRRKGADRERSEQLELQRRNLLQAQRPQLWKELRSQVEQKAQNVNKRIGRIGSVHYKFTEGDGSSFFLESPEGKLEVSLLEALSVITLNRIKANPLKQPDKEPKGSFHFEVKEELVWLKLDGVDELWSVDEAAKHILELLA